MRCHLCRLILTIAILLVPAAAVAQIACPPCCTIPPGITLVGLKDGVPDPTGEFTVVVRDIGMFPIEGASVWIDLSSCSDILLASQQPWPGLDLSCADSWIRGITDATGSITFRIVGSAAKRYAGARTTSPCANILSDYGVSIGTVRVATLDQDGVNGVGPNDVALWQCDFVTPYPPPCRSDYDYDGTLAFDDLAILIGSWSRGNSARSGTRCDNGPDTTVLVGAPGGGLNLAWNDCAGYGGPPTATFACNTNSGGRTLVASMVAPAGIDNLSGFEAIVDVVAQEGDSLADWWRFDSTGCRPSSLTVRASSNASCLWFDPSGVFSRRVQYPYLSPKVERIVVLGAFGSASDPVPPGEEFALFDLVINHAKTTGTDACAGCAQQVDVVLRSVRLVQGVCGTDPLTLNDVYSETPGASATAFWQGGPRFAELVSGLPGVYLGSAAWGDYDNDNDLDLLLTGQRDSSGTLIPTSRVYRNDGGGVFTDIDAALLPVYRSSVAWGDYDNDGDLDILLTGTDGTAPHSRVYRNDGGAFTDVGAALTAVEDGAVAWGDCDNDGDLDLLLTGARDSSGTPVPTSRVYRNDGAGTFTDMNLGLPGVRSSAVAWADFQGNGELGFALAGEWGAGPTQVLSRLYRNTNSGTFVEVSAGLPGVRDGSLAWGDYDNDGLLDLLLSGDTGSGRVFRVYRNQGSNTFLSAGIGLEEGVTGPAAWGDYDNDGLLDILLSGTTAWGCVSRVYRNDGGSVFTDIGAGTQGTYGGSVAWGDYDNDGRLDGLVTGATGADPNYGPVSRVYRNLASRANTPPSAPGWLNGEMWGHDALLNWGSSGDNQTPASGLTYNLRIGTTPGGNQISSPMSAASGYRRVPQTGNAQLGTWAHFWLPYGRYYWSAQAVDGAYAGSPFAAEGSFTNSSDVAEENPREVTFALAGANPSAGVALFRFGLPTQAGVLLTIHDVTGRRVATLAAGSYGAGYHTIRWERRKGAPAAGVYYARFTSDGRAFTQQVVVLR
jgi:hypothetical protein